MDLSPLSMCNIQSIDGLDKNNQCDEIVKIIEEGTEKECNYTFTTNKSIRTFVVPKGVKGFVSDFMRNMHVIERFELPDGLLSIGNNTHDLGDIDAHCVFADCILPEVVIPDSVKEVGSFAFGHSHIESLQLPESLQSPYSRQFKDSYIGTLKLPKEWRDSVVLGEYNELLLQGQWFDNNKYGYLRWPSTTIGTLEFYLMTQKNYDTTQRIQRIHKL